MDNATPQSVTDAKVLAAMTHPLRRRLLDTLRVDGPSTVSTLAERLDEATGNISHHVRVLATCVLIEEAPELSRDRRERWWRLTSPTLRWSAAEVENDPAAFVVATAAESLNLDRQVQLVRSWLNAPADVRAQWSQGAFSVDTWIHLTPDELAELQEQMSELLHHWAQRGTSQDGLHREPVFVFARGVPGRP